jgi:hypothetical protein
MIYSPRNSSNTDQRALTTAGQGKREYRSR